MAVNKERVKLLVDALRSGEYEQGRGALRTQGDTYCCIGVGCEVARRNGLDANWTLAEVRRGLSVVNPEWQFDGSGSAFGGAVSDWYGFDLRNPFLDPHRNVTMIAANDGYNWTFEQIADAVEATFLGNEEEGGK